MKAILCKIGIHNSVNTDGRGMAGEWKCIRCGKITSEAIVRPRCLSRETVHPEMPTERPTGAPPPPPPRPNAEKGLHECKFICTKLDEYGCCSQVECRIYGLNRFKNQPHLHNWP